MQRLLMIMGFLLIIQFAFSQNATVDFSKPPPHMDSLLLKIAAEKNDSTRYYLALSGLTISETNPVLDMINSEKIFLLGKKHNDAVCEVLGLACFGYDYRAFGNNVKSLEYDLQANRVAEKSKDNRLISFAKAMLALNYLDLGDLGKAVAYSRSSLQAASKVEVNILTVWYILDMGNIYYAMNRIDSALVYTQRAYETGINAGINYWLAPTYLQFGSIHAKRNTPILALSYWKLALDEAFKINSPKFISTTYAEIGNYYHNINQNDSAINYSKKAIEAVQNTAFSTMSIIPAKLLLDIYRDKNIDSAFKYSELYRAANDSMFNIKAIQQTQLMTFEEDARQQELAVKEMKDEQERQRNIQYVLIALGIISFIIVFLLLSRSVITNTRIIRVLGIVALLIVFEFLNLLLHPFIERISHHSLVLILLALVCIAALLAPLHHKLETWALAKLVEKNKKIRLAAARKTIEKLEKDNQV